MVSKKGRKKCRDCEREGVDTYRKIVPNSGGRCSTHHRARKRQTGTKAAETRWMNVYGITAEEYWELYEYQREQLKTVWGVEGDGACYICGRAKGIKPRLSVDHDHNTGFIRQLACRKCNRDVLGHLRDDVNALKRAIEVLTNPPARQVIGDRVAPIHLKEHSPEEDTTV